MKFLTLVDTDTTLARQAIDSLRGKLDSMGAVCPFDHAVSGASMSAIHEFGFQRERTRGGIQAGETEKFTRQIYLYAFRSNDLGEKHETAFRQKLMELKQQIEDGMAEFTDTAQKRIEKYLTISRQGRGGRLRVTFNEEECAKAREYLRIFCPGGQHPAGCVRGPGELQAAEENRGVLPGRKAMRRWTQGKDMASGRPQGQDVRIVRGLGIPMLCDKEDKGSQDAP